jgi:hypothetical protein
VMRIWFILPGAYVCSKIKPFVSKYARMEQ